MIVAYKFGIQKGGALSPAEGIKVHFLHAAANEGKVLLTMGRFPSAEYRDDINQVILTTRSGNYAVIGDVEDLSGSFQLTPSRRAICLHHQKVILFRQSGTMRLQKKSPDGLR